MGSPRRREWAAAQAPPEVLVLTTFDTDDHVLRALRVGASGFLLKDTPPAKIVAAIHAVANGEPAISPQVMRRWLDLDNRSQIALLVYDAGLD
jgi:DNA-binding NarL/FixJ family response regulator